ncbi:MAG TPA: hypothetical protein VN025_07370 [Candidatus Dormibacteraeota bacterium]|jgi:hypothetical protein|nr:hypothetical protein [Candidatus Dormibacteraeota bacterium]
MMNGELQAMPLPGPDADKLKKSFEDWKAFQKRAGGNAGATPATTPTSASGAVIMPGSTVIPPSSATPLGPSKILFDDAGQTPTVTRTDGVTVNFLGEQIKIAGYGAQNYLVRHEKSNPGRFLRSTVGGANTRVMGSLSGAGEQFLVDGGGPLYDSGMGIVVGMENDKQLLIPKKLSIIIVGAVAEIRATPGHEKFDPPGYKSLKEISEYHLKSDGTQH